LGRKKNGGLGWSKQIKVKPGSEPKKKLQQKKIQKT